MAEKHTAQNWEPRNKMSAGDLGDATQVRALEKGDKQIVTLGWFAGRVEGVAFKPNLNKPDEPSVALLGVFEGISANPDRAIMRSAVLFLPEAINKMIVAAVMKGRPVPAGAGKLKRGQQIAIPGEGIIKLEVEIGVQKSDSPIGYIYVPVVKGDGLEVADPLSDMRDNIVKLAGSRGSQLQLTGPASKKKKR